MLGCPHTCWVGCSVSLRPGGFRAEIRGSHLLLITSGAASVCRPAALQVAGTLPVWEMLSLLFRELLGSGEGDTIHGSSRWGWDFHFFCRNSQVKVVSPTPPCVPIC